MLHNGEVAGLDPKHILYGGLNIGQSEEPEVEGIWPEVGRKQVSILMLL